MSVCVGTLFFCVSVHKIYSCFSSFFGCQIFLLFLLFYWIVHLINSLSGFFVPWTLTSCLSTYLFCCFEKFIFDIFPSALLFCRNLLTFHWHCLFKFLLFNNIFSTSKFLFLVEYGWVWQVLLIQPNHSQVTCVV